MACLGNEQDYSVIFEIAPKYCILDSFVDYEGYSLSSKAFLPIVVDKMVHSFIELDKVVINVISMVSFLWLWFSFCLPSDT